MSARENYPVRSTSNCTGDVLMFRGQYFVMCDEIDRLRDEVTMLQDEINSTEEWYQEQLS